MNKTRLARSPFSPGCACTSAQPVWIIAEEGTGLMDGGYTTEGLARAMLRHWNRERPRYRHALWRLERRDGPDDYPVMPDHLFLGGKT